MVPATFETSQLDAFYVYLRSDLRTLERSLLDLRAQGRTPPEECIEKLETILSMLDDLICNNELYKIIKTYDEQKPLQSQENDRTRKDVELQRYPSLQSLRVYLAVAPNSIRQIRGNPMLLRTDYSLHKQTKLKRRLQKCNEKLKNLLPGDHGSEGGDEAQLRRRFDINVLQLENGIRERAGRLHGLLHSNWPCLCHSLQEDAIGKSCRKIKLRLGPYWNSCPREFDMLLYGPDMLQECKISVDAHKIGSEEADRVCGLMKTAVQDSCLNIVVDENGLLWDLDPPQPSTLTIPEQFREEITLGELVKQSVKFKASERRILGVILANSLLHLYESPWLCNEWNGEHISFFYHLEADQVMINSRRPYLSTELESNPPTSDTQRVPRRSRRFHRFPSLLALGVLLLELELADELESIYQKPNFQKHRSKMNDNTAFLVAQDLLVEYKYRNIDWDTKPIETCLDRTAFARYANSHSSHDDPEFTREIYKSIVLPLELELAKGLGGRSSIQEILSGVPLLDPVLGLSGGGVVTVHQRNIAGDLLPIIHEETQTSSGKNGSTIRATGTGKHVFDSDLVMSTGEAGDGSDMWFEYLKRTHAFPKTARKSSFNFEDKEGMVKMAVLDTGIDLTHPSFKEIETSEYRSEHRVAGHIAQYWDFVEGREEIVDINGHGTHTAHLLLKVAPHTKLFVARVFRTTEADDNTASLIAKAIRHAVNVWKVDIISMSFGFPRDHPDMQEAIVYASSNNILLFAAASNNKVNEDNPIGYPARVKEHVICVNSSSGQGIRSNFSPEGELGRENFSAIGENVEAAWPLALNEGRWLKRRSGTSCATPIAAGIAALILEYSRQKAFPPITDANKLRQLPGMKKVLFECMTKRWRDGKYNYLKPWKLLTGRPKDVSSNIGRILEDIHGQD